jgi:hypothetical protein
MPPLDPVASALGVMHNTKGVPIYKEKLVGKYSSTHK